MQVIWNQSGLFTRTLITAAMLLVSAAGLQAQLQDRPKAGPEQKQMEMRVGDWTYEGSVSDTPLGPGGKFAGKSSSKMVLDGLFLESIDEDKGIYGGKEIVYKSIGLSWYDASKKSYANHSYDNDGMVAHGTSTLQGRTWSDAGTMTDSKGKSYKIRTTTTYSPDGKKSVTKRELSTDDGKTWMPHWESTATKLAK